MRSTYYSVIREELRMKNKIILTSYGLTSSIGRKLISEELAKHTELQSKKVFLFHEPHYSIENMLIEACLSMGFKAENIILSGQQKSNEELLECDYYYVTEGNTFEVLSLLRERGLDSLICKAFAEGSKTYIGCSAGAMIAGVSIEEALCFDRNFMRMTDYTALGLFEGIVIPHYNKSELKQYIKNTPGIEKKYGNILSVANDGILVIE